MREHIVSPSSSAARPGGAAGRGLAARLYAVTALPMALLLALTLGLWVWLGRLSDELRHEATHVTEFSLLAKDMALHVVQVQQFLSDVSATRARDGLDDGFKEAASQRDAFRAALARYRAEPEADTAALDTLGRAFENFYAAGVAMAQAYVQGGPSQGNPLMPAFDAASTALQARLQPFVAQQTQQLQFAVQGSMHRVDLLRELALGLCAAGLLAVGAGGRWLARSITRPIDALLERARRLAHGDFTATQPIAAFGELEALARALSQMQQQIGHSLRQVHDSAAAIDTASTEVAAGSQDLSQRTERTAAQLQQTTASVDQLRGHVQASARSAGQADELAGAAGRLAQGVGQAVAQVVGTMHEIQTSARRIADITGVIDGIAFQTNILALNAAVEAARAGEQGRGFAVVAAEVRSLAQRAAQAAREIGALIASSVERVDAGAAQVGQAGTTVGELVAQVEALSGRVSEIAAAAQAQAGGVVQVHASVADIDAMTQQNAALVEQSSAASLSLQQQAGQLRQVLAAFRLAPAPSL